MFKKLKAFHNTPNRRPYWQIPLAFLVWLTYKPAKIWVDFCDNNL